MSTQDDVPAASADEGRDADAPGFFREAAADLRDGAAIEALLLVPVILGATIGYLVAGGTGLVVGGLLGAALIGGWLVWQLLSLVRDGVRRLRGR